MKFIPPTLLDAYKLDHRRQYPPNARMVFSNLTPRGSRVSGVDHVVFFGLQYFLKEYLINIWNRDFFECPKEEVVKRYMRRVNSFLPPNHGVTPEHIEALHELGYLPLTFWALPEGTHTPTRVPMFVFWNTHPDFFWLTNAIETLLSVTTWLPCTSATTAWQYRELLDSWAARTDPANIGFVNFQGHDFSYRGHGSNESAITSGAAHLLSFVGTDTLPAVDFLEQYYNADVETEIVGCSVAATEHSVMCMGGLDDELETFRRLIEDVYPNGIVSIVSDTWDFWNVINPKDGLLVRLKDKIMKRDGKVVIRPDSGDPVKIVTGYRWIDLDAADIDAETALERGYEAVRFGGKYYKIHSDPSGRLGAHMSREVAEVEIKGLIESLWDIFGGTTSKVGFRVLDSHIGGIYGDSITLERCRQICERLADKGFASTNLVFGIGSFTYQGAITPKAIVTRDTYGFAVKSTYGEVDDQGTIRGIEIFKDPVTDDGLKKSAKGLISVQADAGRGFVMKDQVTWEDVKSSEFRCVFVDGELPIEQTLREIRARVRETAPKRRVEVQ